MYFISVPTKFFRLKLVHRCTQLELTCLFHKDLGYVQLATPYLAIWPSGKVILNESHLIEGFVAQWLTWSHILNFSWHFTITKDSVALHGHKNSNTKISIGASSSHQTAFSQFVYLIKNDPLKTHLEHLVWQEQQRSAILSSSPSCST